MGSFTEDTKGVGLTWVDRGCTDRNNGIDESSQSSLHTCHLPTRTCNNATNPYTPYNTNMPQAFSHAVFKLCWIPLFDDTISVILLNIRLIERWSMTKCVLLNTTKILMDISHKVMEIWNSYFTMPCMPQGKACY